MTKKNPRQSSPRTSSPHKSSETLVHIDSPDDAELYDTGDAADMDETNLEHKWYNSLRTANDREEPGRLESGLARSTRSRRKDDASRS